jgi:ketosteroid isomerase-like protein
VAHPNEDQLRHLYGLFAKGDIDGFLAGCTDDVTFMVPGEAAVSGRFTKATFMQLLAPVMERSGGTFQEDVLDVFANDDHGVLLLLHRFERDGEARRYNTAHVVEFSGGRISRWEERPGSRSEFEQAWGAP